MGARAFIVLGAIFVSFALSCDDDSNSLTAPSRRTGASSSGTTSGEEGEEGSSGGVSASGGTLQELCFNTINEYRKTKGLPPFTRWSSSEACADGEAKSDADTNRPHGAFPRCGEFAQNECPGNPGKPETVIPQCLRLMWGEGPGGGHYENMASTKWKQVACGVHVTSRGAVWSVQNFK
jgi:hypothetical protein